jgi:hypothetical protein
MLSYDIRYFLKEIATESRYFDVISFLLQGKIYCRVRVAHRTVFRHMPERKHDPFPSLILLVFLANEGQTV